MQQEGNVVYLYGTQKKSLESYFARSGMFYTWSKINRTEEEWAKRGVFLFKRKVLGFCGWETTKSLDELADILEELYIAENIEEANDKIIPKLYGKALLYTGSWGIKFEYIPEKDQCKIRKYLHSN
ncbi:MAG: hypothetical protein Q8R18_03125 [bacterium]|nr:hypothetical protein [bacterium]